MNALAHEILAAVHRVPDSVPWATVGFGAMVNGVHMLGLSASDFALISTGIAALCAAALSTVKVYLKLRRGDSGAGGHSGGGGAGGAGGAEG